MPEKISITDENGYAELEYRYPESYAVWYFAEVTVFGQSTGSEAQASMKYRLEILADDINDEGVSPPANPFGEGDDDFTDDDLVCETGVPFN